MPHKKTHMKTNQDGGSYTAKKPGAAANELQKNQEGAAKMGYKQHFGAARISPSKMGDAKASELMHGAARYYDGAGQYMNGAPKYEGAGKHHGPTDYGKSPMMKGHEGPMMKGHEGPMKGYGEGAMKKKINDGPMTPGHGGASGHTHDNDDPYRQGSDYLVPGSSFTFGKKVLTSEDFYKKPASERVRTTLAAETTNKDGTPRPIQIDEMGFSTNPDRNKAHAENLSLVIRENRRKPITQQETRFEEQFGQRKFDNLLPFLNDDPTRAFVESRRRSEKPADTQKAWMEGPVAQRYQENVNRANQQLEREKGFTFNTYGTTIKTPEAQLRDSANAALKQLKNSSLLNTQNQTSAKPKRNKKKTYKQKYGTTRTGDALRTIGGAAEDVGQGVGNVFENIGDAFKSILPVRRGRRMKKPIGLS